VRGLEKKSWGGWVNPQLGACRSAKKGPSKWVKRGGPAQTVLEVSQGGGASGGVEKWQEPVKAAGGGRGGKGTGIGCPRQKNPS